MSESLPTSPIHRIFLGWDEPALPLAAGELTRAYATEAGLDLRDVVVVTPGSRSGRRLGELLLDEAERRGVPLTPPRVVTLGHLPELFYHSAMPAADSMTGRYALARALQEMDRRDLEEVFPHLPETRSGWMAMAATVQALHVEVGRQGMAFSDVAKVFRSSFSFDDSRRWEVLTRLQESYLRILGGVGLTDRDTERRRVLADGKLKWSGDLWLIGVVEVPGVVREMLRSLTPAIRSLVHAPSEIRDRFDGFGCVVPEAWADVPIPLSEGRLHVVSRPPDQAGEVAEILRGFRGRFEAEEVVVGVPDQELVPYLEQELSMVGVPHRFAGGLPLAETGPARFLKALGEFLRDRSSPAFAALLRHPDLYHVLESFQARGGESPSPGEGGEGWIEALALSDEYLAEHLQARLHPPLPGRGHRAAAMRRLVAHVEGGLGLGSFSGKASLEDWMPTILEVLVRVYRGVSLRPGSRGTRQLVDILTVIKGAAAGLAELPEALSGEVEGWEAVSLLAGELSGGEKKVPPHPEEHAVELLGWLELPLDDAPAVILCGVNDRNIPEAVGADLFLPGSLRTQLGLPDDPGRYARDAYLLSALLASREEAHLVAGRLTAQGDPLMPSRLLFAASPEEAARRVRRFFEGTDRDRVGERREEGGGESESRFLSPPEDPLVRTGPLESLRVTDFSAFLGDPYRFALERVLDLKELDDSLREMSAAVFGTVAHEALERFFRSDSGRSEEVGVLEEGLLETLDHVVRGLFGAHPFPAVRVQVEQLRVRLRRLARWQAAWAREGWEVIRVEEQIHPGYAFEVDGDPVLLRGKIDRIDHNPRTGEWAVFDYKTGDEGKGPEETHRKRSAGGGREWVDLQLPLYHLLLQEVVREDGSPVVPLEAREGVKLGYILLPKEEEKTGASLADWGREELGEAEETARGVVREIRKGTFTFDPAYRSRWEDPFASLLGLKELPLPSADDEEGEE